MSKKFVVFIEACSNFNNLFSVKDFIIVISYVIDKLM